MAADDDILQTFKEFGETLTVSDFIIKQMERYILGHLTQIFAISFTE